MRRVAALAVVLSVSLAAAARADIRVSPEKKEPVRITSKVTVKHGVIKGVDRNVVAKLVVPVSLVRPAEAPRAGAAPKAQEQGALPRNMGTWIAGIALSLAAVSLVFIVRGKRTTRTVAAAVLGGAVVLGAYAAQANVGPSPRQLGPQIVIELAEEGDSVTLLLAE